MSKAATLGMSLLFCFYSSAARRPEAGTTAAADGRATFPQPFVIAITAPNIPSDKLSRFAAHDLTSGKKPGMGYV